MRVGVYQLQNNIDLFNTNKIGDRSDLHKNDSLKKSDSSIGTFKEIFDAKIYKDNSISFTEKASEIMHEVFGILTQEQMTRLETGLSRLKDEKVASGIILMDSNAFLMNVKSQTVISTIEKERVQQNVFSNIDAFAVV
tara:strand:+ start:16779 stop:17192 length:414 start_codon:yes stop_codon:yes gene_type:complete